MSEAIATTKALVLQGDLDAAKVRTASLLRDSPREEETPDAWRELALAAAEQGALALVRDILEADPSRIEGDTRIVLDELLALAPKIPSTYLRLFARGARLGDFETTRSQLLALKKRNLSDAGEVFGQLGLRAPTLRKKYGKLIDPLFHEDGTPRSMPRVWTWLGVAAVVCATLYRVIEVMPSAAVYSTESTIEVDDEDDAIAMDSAVHIVCADSPAHCAEARAIQRRVLEGTCASIAAEAPHEDSAAGDAMRLLHQRAEQACEPQ